MTPAKRTGRDGSNEERKDEEDREEENHDDGHASNDDDASEKQQDNKRSCSESPSNLTASNDDDARAQEEEEEEGRATASSSLAATASTRESDQQGGATTDEGALTSSAGDRAMLSLRGVGGRTIMTLPAPDAVKSSALALLLVERSGVPGAYCERTRDDAPPRQVRGSRRAVEGGGAVAGAPENDSGHDDAADRSSSSSSSRAAAAQQQGEEEENESAASSSSEPPPRFAAEEPSSRTSQLQEQDAVGIDQSSAEETALVQPCSSTASANDDRAARMDERTDENEPDVSTTAPHGPDEEEEEGLVRAILVHDNDVVEAAPLMESNSNDEMHVKRAAVYGGVALAMLATIVGLAVGLATRDGAGDDGGDDESAWSPGPPTVAPSPTYDFRPTLERVADEGVLKCGIPDALGFGRRNETTGEVEGFSVDLVRC